MTVKETLELVLKEGSNDDLIVNFVCDIRENLGRKTREYTIILEVPINEMLDKSLPKEKV